MADQQLPELILNIAPITFNTDQITIGRLPQMKKEEYEALRAMHWKTHRFRFDSRIQEILNVTIAPGQKPLGKEGIVPIQEHLLLVARAIQQNITVWLADELKLPILRDTKKIVFLGRAKDSILLTKTLKQLGLQPVPGVEVAMRYTVDCRMFQYEENSHYLGLIIDISTSNLIELPASELLKRGLPLLGRYVYHSHALASSYLKPEPELLGKVSRIEDGILFLTDTEGTDQISADKAFLEPRIENLRDVITLLYGEKSTRIITTLETLRQPINTANGKLAQIKQTLESLRKRKIILSDNVEIELNDLITPEDVRFPEKITTQRPSFLVGPQGRNPHQSPDSGVTQYGPYMHMQHERNTPLLVVICEAKHRGRVDQFVKMLLDGVSAESWQDPQKSNPFAAGLIGKFRLSKISVIVEECEEHTATAYKKAAERALQTSIKLPDLAIIQTRKDDKQMYGDHNPYFASKSAFMMSGVPTQSICLENLELPLSSLAYLLNNIALAIYAKLDGIPWVISTPAPKTHELVVGLGYAEVSQGRLGDRTRYVGITTVFQGDGRYLLWGLTREVEFENYATALLASLRTTVKHVSQYNHWGNGDEVRLICHVYKRLRDCEVEAIKALVKELLDDRFNVKFSFLDISWWHPYYIFSPQEPGIDYYDRELKMRRKKGVGVPARGLCLQLDSHRSLLHLAGPKELKTSTQGLPNPLLVELHRDSDFTDMTYLLRQIYNFTYMSWRSFFPATEPVTISYSRLIAHLLGNLKTTSSWNSQTITTGSLRDRRWFL